MNGRSYKILGVCRTPRLGKDEHGGELLEGLPGEVFQLFEEAIERVEGGVEELEARDVEAPRLDLLAGDGAAVQEALQLDFVHH